MNLIEKILNKFGYEKIKYIPYKEAFLQSRYGEKEYNIETIVSKVMFSKYEPEWEVEQRLRYRIAEDVIPHIETKKNICGQDYEYVAKLRILKSNTKFNIGKI